MKIVIQTPAIKAPKKLTDNVEKSVMKFSTYSTRILEAQVVLKIEKSENMENKICELKLVIPGNDLFARKQCATFEEAVTKCVIVLKHQINHWKDSMNNGN